MFKLAALLILVLCQLATAEVREFGILGDAGVYNLNTATVRRSMKLRGVQSLILPGDNLYFTEEDTYRSVWTPWIYDGFDFSVVAIGNHTLGYKEEVRFFAMLGEYYVKNIGTSRFIVLNSDNEKTVSQQLRFFESVILDRHSGPTFVVVHHPFVTVSYRHSWREKEKFQSAFRRLFVKYRDKITAVISGHDHIATLVDVNDIPLIVTGASWEVYPAYELDYREGDLGVRTVWNFGKSQNPWWVRLRVYEAADTVWAHFTDAKLDKTMCSARIWPRPIRLVNCPQMIIE